MKQPIIQEFDALTFNLSDIRLIEASAGTGKTYSLCNLYIRLLLGHGGANNSFNRALNVQQILVLTFTRAATFELKERIQKRILQVLDYFSAPDDTPDSFLSGLYQQTKEKDQAISQLRYALALIDQASIYTLHSFCQRIIQENSFSLKQHPLSTFEIDNSAAIKNILLDCWRHLHAADREYYQLSALHQHWSNFESFSKQFHSLLSLHENTDIEDLKLDPSTTFDGIFDKDYYKNIDNIKKQFIQEQNNILALFKSSSIKYYNRYEKWLFELNNFCNNPYQYQFPIAGNLSLLQRFTTTELNKEAKKGFSFNHPLFDEIEILCEDKNNIDESTLINQWVLLDLRARWKDYKLQHRTVYPNDVLISLEHALKNTRNNLADNLRRKYPAALIDEFQDTDHHQYEIFNHIYSHTKSTALVLIGDPKQAIYQFRGADLFTYINAKRSIPSTHIYHMQNNWRSSKALVKACNALFSTRDNAFLNEDIPFLPVKSAVDSLTEKKTSGLKLHSIKQTHREVNLQIWQATNTQDTNKDDHFISSTDAKEVLFNHCSNYIDKLITEPLNTINSRPIRSADICILVRNRADAQHIKSALFERGISSVFLSRENIYTSACAHQLSLFLKAVLNPSSTSSIKTALSSFFYQHSFTQLKLNDEQIDFWDDMSTELNLWREHWSAHGILSMLHNWAKKTKVYQRLKQLHDGLRWITDFQHLAQLLQHQSQYTPQPQALYEHLTTQIYLAEQSKLPESDEAKLRLESDHELISIATIHTSKGLEYPLVFYPYAGTVNKSNSAIIHHQNQNGYYSKHINFKQNDALQKQAQHVALAEEIRLLYVAITRAKYACFLGFANIKETRSSVGFEQSPLAYILGINADHRIENQTIDNALNELCSKHSILFDIVGDDDSIHNNARPNKNTNQLTQTKLIAPPKKPSIEQRWYISSYSQIAQHKDTHIERGGSDESYTSLVDIKPSDNMKYSRLTFPKGTQIGQFLHSILELQPPADLCIRSEHPTLSSVSNNTLLKTIDTQLQLYSLTHLASNYRTVLANWIIDIVNYNLYSEHTQQATQTENSNNLLNLACINENQMIREMNFYSTISNEVNTQQINHLLTQFGYLNKGSNQLAQQTLKGLITGFIDLVFQHQEKYYILDYKSNFLGSKLQDYTQNKMQQAIHSHHYDVQYILYTVALHRLLKLQIKDYCYDTHFGGCYYLFLRGIPDRSTSNNELNKEHYGVYFDKPQQSLIEQLDLMLN